MYTCNIIMRKVFFSTERNAKRFIMNKTDYQPKSNVDSSSLFDNGNSNGYINWCVFLICGA